MSRNKSPSSWNRVRGMQGNVSRLFPKNSRWWQQQFLFHQKLNRKLKRERKKKNSLERISTRNFVEISGVLPENEIKNVYCFLKMGKKKIPIPAGFKARAEGADDREPWDGCVWDRGVLKGPLEAASGLSVPAGMG